MKARNYGDSLQKLENEAKSYGNSGKLENESDKMYEWNVKRCSWKARVIIMTRVQNGADSYRGGKLQ